MEIKCANALPRYLSKPQKVSKRVNNHRNQNLRPFHTPVLFNEVLDLLRVEKGKWYVDATAGGGGHTQGILQQGGNVIAIDQDKSAIEFLQNNYQNYIESGALTIVESNFSRLAEIISSFKNIAVSGILFDLGVSTFQIKQSGRGFSFQKDEPLDMRMAASLPLSAFEVLQKVSKQELIEILKKFGEEIWATDIAEAIVEYRRDQEIRTTGQLQNIVSEVYRKRRVNSKLNPATKTFQAIRIYVNQELANIKNVLPMAIRLLVHGGRCLVISFHSLEDRLVKQSFLEAQNQGIVTMIHKKPIVAEFIEQRNNYASRSAKLRGVEKI